MRGRTRVYMIKRRDASTANPKRGIDNNSITVRTPRRTHLATDRDKVLLPVYIFFILVVMTNKILLVSIARGTRLFPVYVRDWFYPIKPTYVCMYYPDTQIVVNQTQT